MKNKFKIKKINNIKLYQILNYKLTIFNISSIMHRITGVIIFLFIPILLAFIELSLKSRILFKKTFNIFLIKFIIYFLILIYIYHTLTGIKYLILEILNKNYKKNLYIYSVIILIIIIFIYIYINIIF